MPPPFINQSATLLLLHLSHKWILDRYQFSSPFHRSLCIRRPVTGGKATTEQFGEGKSCGGDSKASGFDGARSVSVADVKVLLK